MGECDLSNRACAIHARPPQVDGAYEDWVEALRLIYHSGGFRPWELFIVARAYQYRYCEATSATPVPEIR